MIKREKRNFIVQLKKTLSFLSAANINSKDGFKKALSIVDIDDRYYINKVSTFLMSIPDIRIMKNENIMIYDDIEIKLSTQEHKELIDIIIKCS